MSDAVGLDPDQAEGSAHELAVALSRLDDVSDDLTAGEWIADIGDVTGTARGVLGELQHEVLLASALLLERAELMGLADRIIQTSGAGSQLGVTLAGFSAICAIGMLAVAWIAAALGREFHQREQGTS